MTQHQPLLQGDAKQNPIEALFDNYISECRFVSHLSPETIRGYASVFSLFLRIMPEVTSADLLSPYMLVEFFKRIETRTRIVGRGTLKTGVKRSTIKTQWAKLNSFFAWLERKKLVTENPLRHIRPPHPYYDDPKSLTDAEIHRVYSAITLHSRNSLLLRRDMMMVSLLLYCGLRKNELISLKVRDIDLIKREVTIKSETSKSKHSRILKLHPTLALHIADYFKERNRKGLKTEWLLAATRGDDGLKVAGLNHWVESLSTKSGVSFHLHRFRHTFACKLAEADVHPFKIQKLMGHTTIDMTLKYTRSMKTENMEDDIHKISI